MDIQHDHLSPCRPPWGIHLIAFCYTAPALFMLYAVLAIPNVIDKPSCVTLLSLLTIPALIAGLNLWTLYRPNRMNRWIPIATALTGIAGLALAQTMVVPLAHHGDISNGAYLTVSLVIYLCVVFALSTVGGAILLLTYPTTRRYVFQQQTTE